MTPRTDMVTPPAFYDDVFRRALSMPYNSLTYRALQATGLGFFGGLLGFNYRYHATDSLTQIHRYLPVPWWSMGAVFAVSAVLVLGPPMCRAVGWMLAGGLLTTLFLATAGYSHLGTGPVNGVQLMGCWVAALACFSGMWRSLRIHVLARYAPTWGAP